MNIVNEKMQKVLELSKTFLYSIGFKYTGANDEILLVLAYEKVYEILKKESNLSILPDEYDVFFIDRVCGEFLYIKKSTGALAGFSLTPVVKSISEGDVSVSYEQTKTLDTTLDELIARLISSGREVLLALRRINW